MRDDDIATMLRRAGHKVTPQRMMIIKALRDAGGHRTAAQIAEEVRLHYPVVDLSTVYRTLDVLKRMRVATAIDVGTGDAMFEWAPPEPHHHLVCTSCDGIENLDHRYLLELDQRLRTDLGFVPNLDHFAIFGLCRECQLDGCVDDHPA
jgi:Fur family transcriptional regulator, ferric uptake regulator